MNIRFAHVGIIVSLLFFVTLVHAPHVYACDCIALPVEEALNNADIVFSGRIASIKNNQPQSNLFGEQQISVVFRPIKVWKGNESEIVTLDTVQNKASCNGYWFENGKEYLVYAKRENDGALGTSVCSRTALLADAQSDLTELDGLEESMGGGFSGRRSAFYLCGKSLSC